MNFDSRTIEHGYHEKNCCTHACNYGDGNDCPVVSGRTKGIVCHCSGGTAEAALTVADLLKTKHCVVYLRGFVLSHAVAPGRGARWQIWQDDVARLRFESPDESAVCAEFLRLTGESQ